MRVALQENRPGDWEPTILEATTQASSRRKHFKVTKHLENTNEFVSACDRPLLMMCVDYVKGRGGLTLKGSFGRLATAQSVR